MHSDVIAQVSHTERVLRKRPTTRDYPCVASESMAEAVRRIREARKDLGLTQSQFAERADVSLSSVQRLEQGKRIDSLIEKKAARALGWADDGIDRVHAGLDPGSAAVAAFEAAQVEAKRLRLDSMTLSEMAQIADFVAEVRGDPREGDALMEAFIRRRSQINSTESGRVEGA